MATTYPYLDTLHQIARRCTEVFTEEQTWSDYGAPLPEAEAADIVAATDYPPGVSAQLVALCRACDGFELGWRIRPDQEDLNPVESGGGFKLNPLHQIYRDWSYDLMADEYEDEFAQRLREFHLVEYLEDTDQGLVGIYCNQHHDPELYYYQEGEGDLPEPLGVDITGYLELLKLSFGYSRWQLLLLELARYFAGPRTAPFAAEGRNATWFVEDMTKLNPDFTLEKFVARYAEVRLRRS